MKFRNPTVHKIRHASKSVTNGHTDGRTHGRTDKQPETNMPRQLLRSWGHKNIPSGRDISCLVQVWIPHDLRQGPDFNEISQV